MDDLGCGVHMERQGLGRGRPDEQRWTKGQTSPRKLPLGRQDLRRRDSLGSVSRLLHREGEPAGLCDPSQPRIPGTALNTGQASGASVKDAHRQQGQGRQERPPRPLEGCGDGPSRLTTGSKLAPMCTHHRGSR